MTRARMAAVGCLLLALTSCAVEGVSFRDPRRLEIVSPEDGATVRLPFTIRWRFEADAGRVAVFVDSGPIPPGETLRYLARGDDECLRRGDCPDEEYLSNLNVHLSDTGALTIEGLDDDRPLGRQSTKDRHDITLILLDSSGRRTSEEVRRLTVYVDRSGGG